MGQYTVEQRIQLASKDIERSSTIIAIHKYDEHNKSGRILVRPTSLRMLRLNEGIYLITVSSDDKHISFIRNVHNSTEQLFINIPQKLAGVIEYGTQARVRFQEMRLADFVKAVKDSLRNAYPTIRDLSAEGNHLSISFEGKELKFTITKYDYQSHIEHAGAYIIISSPEIAPHTFKVVYAGYDKPKFFISEPDGTYIIAKNLSYNQQLDTLGVVYSKGVGTSYTKRFKVGPQSLSEAVSLPDEKAFSNYFQALSEKDYHRMGAVGTRVIVDILREHGYEIVKADTVLGRMEGPDIAMLDKEGNKLTIEVKSTSIPENLGISIQKAIFDLETHYFSTEDSSREFVWRVNNRESEFGAKAAIAAGVCFNPSTRQITLKAIRIDVQVRDGKVIFSERIIDLIRGKVT